MPIRMKKMCLIPTLKAKPDWQDVRPSTALQREAWEVMAKHEAELTRAYAKVLRETFGPSDLAGLERYLGSGTQTMSGSLEFFEFFEAADPESFPKWKQLAEDLQKPVTKVVKELGKFEAASHGWNLSVKKAKGKVPTVPLTPNTFKFIERQAINRAAQLSSSEKKRVIAILADAFNKGLRPESIVKEIKATVGLTPIQRGWVSKRLERYLLVMPEKKAEAAAAKFAKKLRKNRARAIARTEMAEAQTLALQNTWDIAEEQGLMPRGTRKQWKAADHSERLSDICRALHNVVVGLGDSFPGGFDRPPAHPNCRSTLKLIFPGDRV